MEAEESLVLDVIQILKDKNWTDIKTNWYIVNGKSNWGVGDVIAKKDRRLLAVECKFINRTNPTQKRRKVKTQAVMYACYAKILNPDFRVKGCWFTNEGWGFTRIIEMEEAVLAVKSHMSRRRSIDIDSFYAG